MTWTEGVDHVLAGHSRRLSTTRWIVGLLIVTYPINYPLFSIIRIVDIVIILSFAYLLLTGRLSARPISVVIGVMVPLVLSSVWGLALNGLSHLSAAGLGFLFKYAELLSLIWVLASLRLEIADRDALLRLSAIVFWVIVLYIYVRIVGPLLGLWSLHLDLRPDFPFTVQKEMTANAGHLMGAYVATGATMWIAYLMWRRRKLFVSAVTVVVVLGSVLLTGSRGPMITIPVTLLAAVLVNLSGRLRVRTHTLRLLVASLILAAAGAFFVGRVALVNFTSVTDVFGSLAERAFRLGLDPSTDQSVRSRLFKAAIGLDNLMAVGAFLGPGPFIHPTWFDNGLIRIAHDLGIIGLVIVVFLVLWLLARALERRWEFGLVPFVGLVTYLVSNLATEFFLVSRSVVPVVVVLWLLLQRTDLAKYVDGEGVSGGGNESGFSV